MSRFPAFVPDGAKGPPSATSTSGATPAPEAAADAQARENAYLRQRNAQLQDDVNALGAEVHRLQQIVERLHGRTPAAPPNPLSGGQ